MEIQEKARKMMRERVTDTDLENGFSNPRNIDPKERSGKHTTLVFRHQ